MKKKRRMTTKQVERFMYKIILEEAIRLDSEKPESPIAFMKRSENRRMFDDMGYIFEHFKHIPEYLYKYRACNEYNFEALEKRCIWLSSASSFIDPFDCRMPFSLKGIPDKKLKKLAKWFIFSEYIYKYNQEHLEKYEMALTSYEVRRILHSNCYDDELNIYGKKVIKFIKRRYKKEEWDKVAQKVMVFDSLISRHGRGKELLDWYKEDAEIGCQETIEMNRERVFVCSLTETNNNPKMWEEYADNYTGFCIGFDFSHGIDSRILDSQNCVAVLKGILPVFYTEKRPKFDSYRFQMMHYENVIYERNDDYTRPSEMAKFIVQDLIKHPRYSNEQEWRVMLGGEASGLTWFPFFTSIYLGKDISNENKDTLLKIAEKINVSVYQQKIGIDGFEYELIKQAIPPKVDWEGKVCYFNKYWM